MKSTKEYVTHCLHAQLHQHKDCKTGVTCRKLSTAKQLTSRVMSLMTEEYERGATLGSLGMASEEQW